MNIGDKVQINLAYKRVTNRPSLGSFDGELKICERIEIKKGEMHSGLLSLHDTTLIGVQNNKGEKDYFNIAWLEPIAINN